MSNHSSQKRINTHHNQVNSARFRRKIEAVKRRYMFEFNRAGIKAKVEADKEYLVICAGVFLIGLTLVVFGLVYIVGAILWG